MAGGADPGARELDQTPTWAVALVCAVIVLISILLEKVLHAVGETFERRRKSALVEALEKIKGELMVLGFISLLLTFGQNYISKICIPVKVANTMLPCPAQHGHGHGHGHGHIDTGEHHRRLLWDHFRILAADSPAKACKPGHVPLISLNGLHQLHIFIFFLAVFHVIYSAITMLLGRLKIREWKEWEKEVEHDYEASNDSSRFRLTKETSFVRDNTSFGTTPILFYSVCFFRQFFRSVRKADYLTMRHGFISVHLAPGSKFNFQKYIKRSLEDDFKIVVGINSLLWFSAVVYLLMNVHGWQAMFWLSILPLVIILAVGTKLQAIIAQMALEIQERHAVVQGIPLVQVSDRHFWFGKPKLILHLVHLTLFQNAFEITYFLWISYEFGLHSCFHDNFYLALLRVAIGLGVQILCSYITLPLYALVTQMGSTMKRSIFDDQTSKALMNWHKNAKKKKPTKPGPVETRKLGSPGDSPEISPITKGGHQSRIEMSNVEPSSSSQTANIVASVDIPEEIPHNDGRSRSTNPDLLTGP
ncbi:PREDICTED: MLO-like protein 9 [Nicotiana attenuata]|uniref:MLO-like protein n=2 Tax=Nicotiana attenuata TaxID=49451 RepID=A0A1J6HYG3_NICAT|nr:PREDICTED: MLO-like protein 9 [Nicotiana attenuata]OIS97900.1 mlo-like protein 5 [Nicotiana attenuata]